MKRVEGGGLVYYTFTHFPEDVVSAFFTRLGGVSLPPYDALNLGLHVGDKPERVVKNRQLACRVVGAEIEDLVSAKQIHSANVRVVTASMRGRGSTDYDSALDDTDGLITAHRRVLLSIYCADCVPVYLVDPHNKVIALVHSGWKGTAKGIARAAVARMREEFGSDPRHILAGIGPSIGPCCYEVDDRVAEHFYRWSSDVLHSARRGRYMLDLWEANRSLLVSSGLSSENIRTASLCTFCQSDQFFSYRRNRACGRGAAFLMMR